MTEPVETANARLGTWRLDVDPATCIGSGMCTSIAPDHFRFDGARSHPRRERAAADEDVLDAAENCPVEAILVRDADTGQVLAPRGGTR